MARQIRTLLRGYGPSDITYTAPTGTAVGKLRVMQVICSNGSASPETFQVSALGQYGSGQPVLNTFTLPASTYRIVNVSIPLLAGDQIKVSMSDSLCSVIVVGEEMD